jgi:hypothetical protein
MNKYNEGTKMEQEKKVIVSSFKVAHHIETLFNDSEDQGCHLSKEGKESLFHSIAFSLPVENFVLTHNVDCFKIARHMIIEVQKELSLMSFEWYGKIYKAIDTFLKEKVEEAKRLCELKVKV